MEWKFEDHPAAVVVELCSNPVNKQNPEYFADLHGAFDRLDREFPNKPVILTARGKIFSAGLDFEHVFPLFAGKNERAVTEWFAAYRETMVRVFSAPRLTIAALNGHTFAGGLVLALCCDFRWLADGDAKLALNEVPIGVPMPSVYTELIRLRLGNFAAGEAILGGKVYDGQTAKRLGLVNEVVPAEQLVEAALAFAGTITSDAWPAYVQAKRCFLHPTLQTIETTSRELDVETLRVMMSPSATRLHARTLESLKAKKR